MWTRSHSITTRAVSKEQMWKLFADVNNWHRWDAGVEFAKLQGAFEKGNHFILRPKGGPNVKIKLVEVVENRRFTDFTRFPLAKMYGDHLLEESADGLKITTTMSVSGVLGFLWIKLVAQKIVDDLPADMEMQVQAAAKL